MDIEYLLFLQNIRERLPNFLAHFMMFVSNAALLMQFLIPLFLFWCVSKRKGVFVAYTLGFSMVFNQLLKNIFCVYRPWIRDARVQPFGNSKATATGYSFPSGHSQIAASTFGSVAYCYWRVPCFANVMIAIAFLIGFSRNYLGCHTPQDVLVGWFNGAIFILVMHHLLGWVWSNKKNEKWIFIGGIAFALIMLIITEFKRYPLAYTITNTLVVDPEKMKNDCFSSAGILVGILLGVFLEQKFVNFEIEYNWQKKTIQFAIGSAVCVLIFGGIRNILSTMGAGEKAANFFAPFAVMMFIFYLGPLAIKSIKLLQENRV